GAGVGGRLCHRLRMVMPVFADAIGFGRLRQKQTVRERILHQVTNKNETAAIGTQYFKQVVMTWSMRRRGSVQRTHIMTVTPIMPLLMILIVPSTLPARPQPRPCWKVRPSMCATGIGPFQPPRNRIEASRLTAR